MKLTSLQNNRYKIQAILGQGGYGITYLAEQTTLGRQVAIKEFFMKDYCGRAAGSPEVTLGTDGSREMLLRYREKFKKEAATLARLNHPNIVRVIDMFEENNTYYYVMEYADGPSLSQIIKARVKLPTDEAFAMIRQVVDAVSYLHQKGLCHYDIKPANILTNSMGKAILADFGLAKQYDEQGEETSTTPVGKSKGYAPPEQYKAGGVSTFSPETDIYALAATFYKLLTGITPIESISRVDEEIAFSILPANFAGPIRHAMSLKRLERYHSTEEFMEEIKMDEKIEQPAGDETDPEMEPKIKKSTPRMWQRLKAFWQTESRKKIHKKVSVVLSVLSILCYLLFNSYYWHIAFYSNPTRAHEPILISFILLNILTMVIIFSCPIDKKLLTWTNVLKSIATVAQIANIYIACIEYYEEFQIGIGYKTKNLMEKTWKNYEFKITGITNFSGKYELYNNRGEQILPGEYDYIITYKNNCAAVEKDGKWAIANEKGLITDFKYDDYNIYGYDVNRISVKKNNKWGCIDTTGVEVIQFIYQEPVRFEIYNIKNTKITAKVTDYNGNTYWIDKDGNRLPD